MMPALTRLLATGRLRDEQTDTEEIERTRLSDNKEAEGEGGLEDAFRLEPFQGMLR